MEMGKRSNRRLKGDAIVAQATDLGGQRNAYQGVLMGMAMVCMMRAEPARFPLVLPDASSKGAPGVAVERSSGSSLPRSTRSRSGRSSRKRCTMLLIKGPSLACFTARVMARHKF